MEETIGIVGGGIVGLAVGRELLRRRPGTRVVVLEKEQRLAAHQTGHNSGVVHAGIYYRPGSLKAQLCTRGRALLEAYVEEHGIPGLRRLQGAEITEVEPHAFGIAALHSPATGIVDYVAVAEAMAGEIRTAGGEVRLDAEVTAVERVTGGVAVTVGPRPADPVVVDRLVVCGGLQSDRLGELVGGPKAPRIVPFRGEYMRVTEEKRELVRGMVYPVPDPRYPFLGVHFTRRVDGSLEVGPNAFLAVSRDRYGRASFTARDLGDTLAWPGFWRFAAQHWRTGLTELRGVLSRRAYMRAAQRYVPEIGVADVVRAGMGLRAQALGVDGSLVDDFVIHAEDRITSVRNAPSPAATSSLAIAEYVADRLAA